jgi:hypothetical protein
LISDSDQRKLIPKTKKKSKQRRCNLNRFEARICDPERKNEKEDQKIIILITKTKMRIENFVTSEL